MLRIAPQFYMQQSVVSASTFARVCPLVVCFFRLHLLGRLGEARQGPAYASTLSTCAACLFSRLALIMIHVSLNGQSQRTRARTPSVRDGGASANVLFHAVCSLRLSITCYFQELQAKADRFRRVEESEG